MKFGLITRPNENQWGGDLRAIYAVGEGLVENGHEVKYGKSAKELLDCDFVFISNTCLDQRENYNILKGRDIRYGVLGFHEDFLKYFQYSFGLAHYIKNNIEKQVHEGFDYSIDRLMETPEIIKYLGDRPPMGSVLNYEVLRDAEVCVANSYPERETMLRDCPTANAKVVYWTAGNVTEWDGDPDNSFLELTGLDSKEYMLQVGRLESRKNQLGTIMATMDIDVPLVFIATKGYQPWLDHLVVNAANKFRKHKTIIVSEQYKPMKQGNIEIIQMPNQEKLPLTTLQSAYYHSRLHVHPAFFELPGYTYLEASWYKVPSVASSWCTIMDYFEKSEGDPTANGLLTYNKPYDFKGLHDNVNFHLGNDTYEKDINFFKRTKKDLGRDILKLIKK